MVAVCIAGMHRSGTSMVAHILHDCGLDLGPREKWKTVGHSNPDGFWEHVDFLNINDEILHRFDGGWDFPPTFPPNWHTSLQLKDVHDRAEKLIAEFSGKEFWGWKDPRNSLTLPFWKNIVPDLKVIHCVRSPVEVRKSLKKRGSNSKKFSFSLWEHYVDSLLENAKDSPYLATNYHNYFLQPLNEVSRIVKFIGMDKTQGELENIAREIIKPALFTQTDSLDELLNMPDSTKNLYVLISREADENFDRHVNVLDGSGPLGPIVGLYAYELEKQIPNYIRQISEGQQHRNVLLSQMESKDEQIQNLTLMAKELVEIQSSRAWKLIQSIRKVKSWLVFNRKPTHSSPE